MRQHDEAHQHDHDTPARPLLPLRSRPPAGRSQPPRFPRWDGGGHARPGSRSPDSPGRPFRPASLRCPPRPGANRWWSSRCFSTRRTRVGPQTSWREWGGIQTQQDVEQEIARIKGDLEKLQATADFPLEFLPLATLTSAKQLKDVADVASADAFLVFAANGDLQGVTDFGKPAILFIRHKSGPLYLWYEIVSPRYLRQHTDELKLIGLKDEDVVVDNYDEVLWRLRGLCGLANTMGTKILCIGGPGGWAQPAKRRARSGRRSSGRSTSRPSPTTSWAS